MSKKKVSWKQSLNPNEETIEEEETEYTPPTRIIKHIVVDERDKPKQKPKPTTTTTKQDENKEWLSNISEKFLEEEKEKLIGDYPQHGSKIRSVESGFDLEVLRDKLIEEEGIQKPKVKGKARLIEHSEPSDLDSADTHSKLINRLYKASKFRDKLTPKMSWSEYPKEAIQTKKDAQQRRDKLFNNLRHTSLEEMTEVMRGTVFYVCPSCGSVTSSNLNKKGGTCEFCGHVVGRERRIKKR